MVKQEDRISYGEICLAAEYAYNKFNGWINPSFKASRLIFDDNKSTFLGMTTGNIIVFFPRNVLQFYYETLNIDFTKQQIKSFVIFLIVHELSHLEQDLAWYETKYKDRKTAEDIVEASNNANTYNYLLAAKNNGFIDSDIQLMWPGFWYTKLKDNKTYKSYLDQYYRVSSPIDKALYSISILCMGYTKFMDLVNQFLNVEIEYDILDNLVFKEIIKVNNMYIHPSIIMDKVVNRIMMSIYSGFNTTFYTNVSIKKVNSEYIVIKINNTEKPSLLDVAVRVK